MKQSVQFKVDMTTVDLVKVDDKILSLILNIRERDYVNRRPQQSKSYDGKILHDLPLKKDGDPDDTTKILKEY